VLIKVIFITKYYCPGYKDVFLTSHFKDVVFYLQFESNGVANGIAAKGSTEVSDKKAD